MNERKSFIESKSIYDKNFSIELESPTSWKEFKQVAENLIKLEKHLEYSKQLVEEIYFQNDENAEAFYEYILDKVSTPWDKWDVKLNEVQDLIDIFIVEAKPTYVEVTTEETRVSFDLKFSVSWEEDNLNQEEFVEYSETFVFNNSKPFQWKVY